jgi:CheY-like chemotaxis protein
MITVLNVDRSDAVLRARSAMLRAHGFMVLEATTGFAALAGARHLKPDVIVLDMHLPDIEGWELCRKLKEDRETRTIAVVQLLEGAVAPHDWTYALETGEADAFCTEPIGDSRLAARVWELAQFSALCQHIDGRLDDSRSVGPSR